MEKLSDGKLNSSVKIGSKVKVLLVFSEDDTEEMTVVLKNESSLKDNIISVESPLGQSILGKSVGDKTNYKVNGKAIDVEILAMV